MERAMSDPVLVAEGGGVGRITLNRPEVMNAISVELGEALDGALAHLGARARVIVIRGAGGNFCVGGDFRQLERLRADGGDAVAQLFDNFRRACARIGEIPVPVVAAVEGYAMAGGFELMQASDIAVVAAEAKLADNSCRGWWDASARSDISSPATGSRAPRLSRGGWPTVPSRRPSSSPSSTGSRRSSRPSTRMRCGESSASSSMALTYRWNGASRWSATPCWSISARMPPERASTRSRPGERADMTDDSILLEVDEDGVAQLRLNRPETSNGMDVPFLRAFYDAIMRCHGDSRVRAVILSGAGANFCAGGDVKVFASKGEDLPDYLREATSWLQISAAALTRLSAPVIAAVHGFAAGGGGFGLVCACDLVFAAESAKFLTGATRVGMAPDAGTTVTLSRLVGLRKTMELLLLNPTLTAAEALDLGIVTRVVPDDALQDETLGVARRLAAGAPRANAETKRMVWEGIGRSLEEGLPDEGRTVSALSGTADAREGLAAVIERRTPSFTGQ